MLNSELYLSVQKLILDGFAVKGKPLNTNQVRDLCKTCAFAVNRKPDEKNRFHRYFHPLVRAGLIECLQNEEEELLQSRKTICWTFSPPAVYYKDLPSGSNAPDEKRRRWIGFNLPQDMYNNQIPPEYTLLNEDEDPLYDYIVKWETPLSYSGDGLPVKRNPSPVELLQRIPNCSPVFFGQKSFSTDVASFSLVYNPGEWTFMLFGGEKCNGFYQRDDQSYSSRIYYRNGLIYDLNLNPDSELWARLMHCVDNDYCIAEYNEKEKSLFFYQPIPFLLGRIFFFNQMFSNCSSDNWNRTELSSDRKYYNVSSELVNELKRIFNNKSIHTRGS